MLDNNITLYHANWCGHCKNFMPTWNALKDVFDKNNVTYAEYESDNNSAEVSAAGIRGFPTIRISKNGQNKLKIK